jgi:hypothetical protein
MKRGKGIEDWLRDYYLLREELDQVTRRKIDCVKENQFEFAIAFRDKEKKLLRRYKALCVKIKANL